MAQKKELDRAVALGNANGVFVWGPQLPEIGSFVREAAGEHAEKLREIAEAEELLARLRADAVEIQRRTALRIAEHYTREEILAARRLAFP